MDINVLETSLFLNKNWKFQRFSLPPEINYSSMYDVELLSKKGNFSRFLIGGNQYNIKPQFGRQDASKGYLLDIEISNDSIFYSNLESLKIDGQIRKFEIFN